MTIEEKKEQLEKLKHLLKEAYSISNDLIGEEKSPHTNNENMLYIVRQEIGINQTRLDFVKY